MQSKLLKEEQSNEKDIYQSKIEFDFSYQTQTKQFDHDISTSKFSTRKSTPSLERKMHLEFDPEYEED